MQHMHWYYLLPLISGLIGWIFNTILIIFLFKPHQPKKIVFFTFQGILPKKQQALANRLATIIAEQFPLNDIKAKISSPESVNAMLPAAESAIDDFLRKKLVEKMPMLSMFVSDRLINELKNIFIDEIKILFPVLINKYADNILNKEALKSVIHNYLNNITAQQIEIYIKKNTPILKIIQWWGLVSGLLIGVVQLCLILLS
ncbi:DUF445 domain-containing protein [Hydrotalea sandarakina]|jgi:uncharacterized membrane protein YheB (UPF0754 family)|uniref:DUF445 family protein n=1 Tax=Hydrotalea sandarakina TaxID=1004304 RepID=A0A2W7S594_9BACT|nr:hypothetical protein [Hydrotalea sandarakina]PZX66020.1 hypothetical protein LX80_00517 [Hydrotalea sandarakina]